MMHCRCWTCLYFLGLFASRHIIRHVLDDLRFMIMLILEGRERSKQDKTKQNQSERKARPGPTRLMKFWSLAIWAEIAGSV